MELVVCGHHTNNILNISTLSSHSVIFVGLWKLTGHMRFYIIVGFILLDMQVILNLFVTRNINIHDDNSNFPMLFLWQ